MNVVMVLDNNQNNILPYRSRFLQMPKVEFSITLKAKFKKIEVILMNNTSVALIVLRFIVSLQHILKCG